jgi:hypothetical protein
MSEQILKSLKIRLENELADYFGVTPEIRQNKIKEILQYYALNFIYHHPEYSKWIMYGGSALRIIHGLDRMSVDLDFEVSHEVNDKFLEKLRKELNDYFVNTYAAGADFLTVKVNNSRGLLLKFNVGKELSLGRPSNQVHIKIDLNHFVAPKTVTERRPINRDQFSFVILVYNMSALMASKLAAIFLRDQRGIDKSIYNYKGRDIYDLLWYMGKKTTPDFDYLNAKLKERKLEIPEIKTLFNKLTVDILNYEKMDELLKKDLSHLFENPLQSDGWLRNWRESYLRLLDEYKIRTIKGFERLTTHQNILSSNFSFIFWYKTEEDEVVRIIYNISDRWILFKDIDLQIEIDKEVREKSEISEYGWIKKTAANHEKLLRYATLFFRKNENYFKKTNRVMAGDNIVTKIIRESANNFNPKEQILIDKSTLPSCELDDLLK